MIWGYLTSRLAGPIATGVAVLLAILLGVQTVKLAGVRGDLQKMQTSRDAAIRDLGTCKANTSTLESSLKAQNEAVKALKADGDAMVAESRKAAADARKVAESYRRSAAAILGAKPKGADACASADRLIEDFAG